MEQITITPVIDAVEPITPDMKDGFRLNIDYATPVPDNETVLEGNKIISGKDKIIQHRDETSLSSLKSRRDFLIAEIGKMQGELDKLNALIPLADTKLDEEIAKK